MYIKAIKVVGGDLVIELFAMENKVEIMKRKTNFKGIRIWIQDDLTERARQDQEWLESLVREERVNSLKAKVGYMKIKVEENWYEWKEKEGRIVEANFQGEGGQEENQIVQLEHSRGSKCAEGRQLCRGI